MKAALLLAMAMAKAEASAAAPPAAEPSWTVSAATAATLGAEFTAVYRLAPSGGGLAPDALASQTTAFAIVSAAVRPDGSWAWTLLPLDAGRLSFTARWTRDGRPLAAPPLTVSVAEPSLPADADVRDIKPPRPAAAARWPWLPAGALALAAWAAWRAWRNRTRRPGGGADAGGPPPPPEAAAERAVAALAASGLWERGEHAAYYLRLTGILREYLEARYGEPATAMTSAEAARLVKSRAPDLRAAASAREVLERADLVKFARLKAGPEDGPRDAEAVLALTRATTPAPPAAAAAEARS